MGTYWNEFLYQFPWVVKLPVVDILELFWHWCGSNGQKSTVFNDRLKSASEKAEAQPQADNTGMAAEAQICQHCNGSGKEDILGKKIMCIACGGTGKGKLRHA